MNHKVHKKNTRKKALLAFEVALSLALVLMVGGYFSLTVFSGCTYTIIDGDVTIRHTSRASDPGEILREAGITLEEKDIVTASGGSVRGTIEIQRAQHVTVSYGNVETKTVTYGGTVGQLLETLNISLTGTDAVTAEGKAVSTEDMTYDGMTLAISRVTTETETVTVAVPYGTVSYLDPTLKAGEKKIQTPGVEGENKVTRRLKYVNGQLVEEAVTGTYVLSDPIDEVVLVGSKAALEEAETAVEIYKEPEPSPSPSAKAASTQKPVSAQKSASTQNSASTPTPAPTPAPTPKPVYTPPAGNTITTSGGEVISYSKSLSVTATAYTGGGTTATGTSARYGAIAVDPKVIPYGTRMYIVSDDGKWIYGYATAEDCGGAIKGNIIDLYFDSYDTCIQFGRRACTVYILD